MNLPHKDLRVSADTVVVSNDLHNCSRPQAILKVQPPNSLDYRVCYKPPAEIIMIIQNPLKPLEGPLSNIDLW